jgi:hypothetical protein
MASPNTSHKVITPSEAAPYDSCTGRLESAQESTICDLAKQANRQAVPALSPDATP